MAKFRTRRRRGVVLSRKQRATHLWVIGQPGTGKSRAIESWVMTDIKAGRGVGVFDPHSDLFNHLLLRTATLAQDDPALEERVVVLNPLDPTWTVGFNPLQLFAGATPERVSWFLTDVVVKIWHIDSSIATRMIWLLAHTFLALAELGLTLVELPTFLRDADWRNQVVQRLTNTEVKHYFQNEFPRDPRRQTEWMQSTLNKMGAFVLDPDIRYIVGQRHSTIDFRRLLDEHKVLLVNLPKGQLGTENSQLLGAFLAGQIQQAALSRADTAERPPFYLYLDEFQNYTTDHIQEILSESRKYNLSLVLAHQYLAQLPPEQKDAVMNTAGTLACFRVGHQDAEELAKEIFQPNVDAVRRRRWKLGKWGPLPLPLPENQFRTLSAEWERTTRELTTLQSREFWVKQRGDNEPIKQYSLDMPDPEGDPETLQKLVHMSGARYGRLKEAVQRELDQERPQLLDRLAGRNPTGRFAAAGQQAADGGKRAKPYDLPDSTGQLPIREPRKDYNDEEIG